MCTNLCGDQRTALGSWFFPSTVGSKGRMQVIRLAHQALSLPSHLSGPIHLNYWVMFHSVAVHIICVLLDGLWSSFFFYFMQNIQLWTFCLVVLVWMQVSVFLLVMYLRIELLGCMMTLLSPFRDSFLKWLPTSMPVLCLLHILANLCFALLIVVLWMGVRGHLIVVWLSSYGVGWCCMSSCTHWALLYLFWVLSFLILCPFENWLFVIFIIDV